MNILLHNTLALYRKVANKTMKLIGRSVYFETAYGIKAYSKPPFIITNQESVRMTVINPSEVLLSFDGLNDAYTHVGMSLAESPHVELIKAIRAGEDITKTRYFKEEINGCLDGRYEHTYSLALVNKLIKASKAVKKGYPIVYRIGETYYVLDGKHRLATAVVDGVLSVQSMEIPREEVAQHIYTKMIYKNMLENSGRYQKNIRHIESLNDRL